MANNYAVQPTASEQNNNLVMQNMRLSYNPALQGHPQVVTPQAHFATPVQVTRPPPVPIPQPKGRPQTLLPMSYQSKYGELLNVIEDLGREIKPTYAGSKMAQERLKKGIMHARALVRECLAEVEKSAQQ